MIKSLLLSLLLFGCTLEIPVGGNGPSDRRTQVALVPTTASNDVDMLFVIDDSPLGGEDLQRSWQQAFPTFLQTLGPNGLPNIHVGVVSTDLGTKGVEDSNAGPSIGGGPGSCAGNGKNGQLQTSASITAGDFIVDRDTGGGVRETNYTGILADAFSSISSLGSDGCGFEQPLHAAKRALEHASVGFVRANASLAVIVLAAEDDCSFAHSGLLSQDTSTLGPLMSFRCTRFGVTCDQGGATTDEMNKLGVKERCHSNESSNYLMNVSAFTDSLKAMKGDSRNVMFGAIAGTASSLEVELREPPGGGARIPALRAACAWSSNVALEVSPAFRIGDVAKAFERHYVQMACGVDMTAPAIGLAREIRGMLGDACITRTIATPSDCEAWDTRADGSHQLLPACSTASGDCWRFVQDSSCAVQGLRVEIVRATAPPTDTMTSVRCKL